MASTLREDPRSSEPVETVPVTVLLAPAMRDRLAEAARANERSVGGEVRVALRRHLERSGETEGEAHE